MKRYASQPGGPKGPADDGKRSEFTETVDVLFCFSERRKRDRAWERKGLGVSLGRRVAGS